MDAGLPRVGEVIGDRFVLDRLAAAGGMGAVYQARDRRSGAVVAVKLMLHGAREHAERFERESRLLAELTHPAIVQHVAHGVLASGDPWLAMAWLEGEDLYARLTRGPLSVTETLTLARRLARALSLAHARGVVHRDLKPSNVFLVEGDIEKATLLDFGIARTHGTSLTRTGSMIGTVGYMAPEQARGEAVGPTADVFSLGCVIFECLTGRLPFPGDTPIAVLAKILLEEAPRVSAIFADIPEWLDQLLVQMLTKDPTERLRDAVALAGALAESSPVLPRRPPTLPAVGDGERILVSVMLLSVLGDGSFERSALDGQPGIAVEWLSPTAAVATLRGIGAPTDRAADAARTALAIRSAIPRARIVLATGRAVTSDRVPVGEVIDRAVAILRESTPDAREGGIRIDHVTAGLLDGRFDVEADAKGFALRAERPRRDTARTLLGRPSPFVGRDRELQQLRSWIDEAVASRNSRAIVVSAPAGVGKSRLRFELLSTIVESGTDIGVMIERGEPSRAGSPFGMLAPIIRRAAGIVDSESHPQRRWKLAARVARNVAPQRAARVTAFLGEMIGTPFDDVDLPQLSAARRNAELMGDQIRRAFEDFFEAESRARPVLLVVDDLQWCDRASIDVLDSALRNLHSRSFVVMALARPDVQERFPDLWSSHDTKTMELAPLTETASRGLVVAVLGEHASPSRIAHMIELAEGNAFYLEELVRAVATDRSTQLPETVLAMAQARFEEIAPDARRVLRAASVFGGAFWSSALSTMIGNSDEDVAAVLDRLVTDEVIAAVVPSRFRGEREFVFRHALVREAAYAMLPDRDRTSAHQVAAEWLARAGEPAPGVLAEHFDIGEDPGRAVAHYLHAAELALDGGDFQAVLRISDRGAQCGADGVVRGKFHLLQAQAHRWRGEHRASARAAECALGLLERGSDEWFSAAAELATESFNTDNVDAAIAVCAQLREMVSQYPTASCISAAGRTASSLFKLGRVTEGEWLLEAIDSVDVDVSAEARARVLQARAKRSLVRGDAGNHLALSAAAAAAFEDAGDTRASCAANVSVGYGLIEVGDYEQAEAVLRRALEGTERLGLRNMTSYTMHNLGIALARAGKLAEGREYEECAAKAFHEEEDPRGEAGSRIYLSEMHCMTRSWKEAEMEARAAIALAADPSLRALANASVARALRGGGDVVNALAFSADAAQLLDAAGWSDEGEALVRVEHAECLLLIGRRGEAARAVEIARARLFDRASKILDEEVRWKFLHRVPEHARTISLAEQLEA